MGLPNHIEARLPASRAPLTFSFLILLRSQADWGLPYPTRSGPPCSMHLRVVVFRQEALVSVRSMSVAERTGRPWIPSARPA